MKNEDRKEIIDHCEVILDIHSKDSVLYNMATITLAALTAQPVKLPEKYLCVGHMGEESLCLDPEEVISAIRAAGYEVQE